MVTIFFRPFDPNLMISWPGYLVSTPLNQFDEKIHVHVCFFAGLKQFSIITSMQRLSQLGLSPNDKVYLRERALDGVCTTPNGHQCYLGLIIYGNAMKMIDFSH